ncbi:MULTISPECIES: YcjF family protein [Bosea]|uniref:YcjF family protein n=1 Tax=Bosea TaxID=85413 RepID=UPI00214FE8B3|nr:MULTISPECIES: TIGR01620 family protein [Bosea]MCR4521171.1 TIGR01620 family protein [Bosea sp. 47.2.35]MDR6830871.1 putative membrane protein [Bosea robiniae]MDR6897655.1 putative membrane protein [Bosea sp. BE109]MDR7141052.1 putative membrane protein [Bosea sp. BE168]MDR7177638.1 putative membrane protein [Bosea sp. BE271]
MSKAPRAIRLDSPQAGEPAGEVPIRQGDLAILPESEPIDAVVPAVPAKARRGFSWGSLFVAGLSGFLALAAGVWVENTIRSLMSQNPALGYAALACAAVATLALLVMLARVLRDILRERKVEALRERAAAALVGGTPDEGRAIAGELVALYKGRAPTAQGRAALQEALPQLFAARDMLTVAERSLLAPLDAQATAQIAQAARRVSLVTAVSPRALVDVVFVLVACARLLRSIAGIYAGRPGTLGLLRLARQVMNHLVLTGGIAAGDAVIQQVVGQGLAARLSAKLGEGVINGMLTARIGLAALAVCRPLPFVAAPAPTLSDVAGDLGGWRSGKDDEA